MMLKIFLPEKIGTFRIIPQKIVGLSLSSTHATGVLVRITQNKRVIKKTAYAALEDGSEADYQKRAAQSLQKVIQTLGNHDQVYAALPLSLVTIKELSIPFLDRHKIRMVIDYEVESMLPFPLDDALIDFIITSQDKQEGRSEVLAVAVRKTDAQEILDLYNHAGIQPTILTVDLIALYGLYLQIPDYVEPTKGSALIDLRARSTRIAFIQEGRLRLIRNIPKGIDTLAEQVSADTTIPIDQVLSILYKTGMRKTNEQEIDVSIEKHALNLFNDIAFTLNSFSLKLNFFSGITKLIYTGPGAHLEDMMEFSSRTLQIPSEIFNAEKAFKSKRIKNMLKRSEYKPNDYLFALAIALPDTSQEEFNLRTKELSLVPKKRIVAQVVTALCLSSLLLAGFGIYHFTEYRRVKTYADRLEQRQILRLKELFPKNHKALKTTSLRKLLREGEKLIGEKEDMWAPFAQQRLRPLIILQEMTRLIDKQRFDVKIDQITIASDEQGVGNAEVTGFFRSKTGFDHFHHFGVFEKSFSESKTLVLVEEIDPTLADEKAVKFTAKLKQKE